MIQSQVATKHMTGFTCEYLAPISYYLLVQKYMTGGTREYFQLVSNRSRAMYFLCSMSPTLGISSNFLGHKALLAIFCKLGRELYCKHEYLIKWYPFAFFGTCFMIYFDTNVMCVLHIIDDMCYIKKLKNCRACINWFKSHK